MTPEILASMPIVKDYAEFSNQGEIDIAKKILNFQSLTKKEFRDSKSQFDFYENSKNYIYDLLSAHNDLEGPVRKINKFLPGVLDYIKEHPGKKFLEFGGGIGDICQIMNSWGKDVTYVDIQSHVTDFALWRFKKYNVAVNIKIIPQDNFYLDQFEMYDFIYQDAVLEHLMPHQQISYNVTLAQHLNENGVFVMVVDLSGESDDMPMHYDVDIVKVHDAIENNGLTCYYGKYSFASVWMRYNEDN